MNMNDLNYLTKSESRLTKGQALEILNNEIVYHNADIKKALEDAYELGRREIINLAENFECCPNCGSENIQSHFCPDCKQRYIEPDDAYFFWVRLK